MNYSDVAGRSPKDALVSRLIDDTFNGTPPWTDIREGQYTQWELWTESRKYYVAPKTVDVRPGVHKSVLNDCAAYAAAEAAERRVPLDANKVTVAFLTRYDPTPEQLAADKQSRISALKEKGWPESKFHVRENGDVTLDFSL